MALSQFVVPVIAVGVAVAGYLILRAKVRRLDAEVSRNHSAE